jgi:hypothetical protein
MTPHVENVPHPALNVTQPVSAYLYKLCEERPLNFGLRNFWDTLYLMLI